MVLPSARLLTSHVLNSCQIQPSTPQGVKGKNDLRRSLCQEILLTCFTTLELIVFAKKQCGCNSQAGWSWKSEGRARLQGHSTAVRVALPRGHVSCRLPRPAPLAEPRFLRALDWGTKSEEQLCLDSFSLLPLLGLGLVSLLPETSPWKQTSLKKCF